MKKIIIPFLGSAIIVAAVACQKNEALFENSVYLNRSSDETVSEMLISTQNELMEGLCATVPVKTGMKVMASIQARPDLLDEFNTRYGEHAELLDGKFYELSDTELEIPAGNVTSTEAHILFKNLIDLEKKHGETYVLPVSITSSNINIIPSRSVKYYFLRGSNLINYAPFLDGDYDVDNEVVVVPGNYYKIDWKDKSLVRGWTSFTYEGLFCGQINKKDSSGKNKRSNPEGIVSLMGTEKGILLRWWRNSGYYNKFRWLEFKGLGENGDIEVHLEMPYRDEQNVPPLYDKWTYDYGLPNGEWFSLTASYDGPTGVVKCWLNGEKVFETVIEKNLMLNIYPEGKKEPEFYLGHANGTEHWWPGMMSECRVWNRALTDEEITADPLHSYYLDPDGAEGLIGYWKLNEGKGDISKDYSGNGNDAVANVPVAWRKVSLPAD